MRMKEKERIQNNTTKTDSQHNEKERKNKKREHIYRVEGHSGDVVVMTMGNGR